MNYLPLFLLTLSASTSALRSWSSAGNGMMHRLEVTQDVLLERSYRNFNYLTQLIVGLHRGYPLKRSLLQFENLGTRCPLSKILWAKMYIYFIYAHKASWHSPSSSPWLSHMVRLHQVKKSWIDSQATSTKRTSNINWSQPYLNLGSDAASQPVGAGVPMFSYRPAGFIEFDVTSAIKSWRNGAPNYGVLMKVDNEISNGRGLRFASNADGNQQKHAYIHVKCRY